jgi:prefoldin subunit 5
MSKEVKAIDAALKLYKKNRDMASKRMESLNNEWDNLDIQVTLLDLITAHLQEERALWSLVQFCRTGKYPC